MAKAELEQEYATLAKDVGDLTRMKSMLDDELPKKVSRMTQIFLEFRSLAEAESKQAELEAKIKSELKKSEPPLLVPEQSGDCL